MRALIRSFVCFAFFAAFFLTQTINAKSTIFPLAFYSPETSIALGGAITLSSPASPQNNLAGIAYITLKGQYMISNNSIFCWDKNKWRFQGDLSFSRFPDRLYAIGPNSSSEYGRFTRSNFSIYSSLQHQIGQWYVGPVLNTAFLKSSNVETADGQTPENWIGFTKASIFGLGFNAVRDHRDHPFDPRRGSFTQFSYIQYLGLSGSFSQYAVFKFDYRRYVPMTRWLSWAGAVSLHLSGQNSPYHTLPHFGDQSGARLMRGYYSDRYRDHCLLAFQNELRIQISSRLVAQVFTDIGQVAPSLGALKLQSFKATFGIGIGFFVDKEIRLPIFLEGGWSKEGVSLSVKPMAAF